MRNFTVIRTKKVFMLTDMRSAFTNDGDMAFRV